MIEPVTVAARWCSVADSGNWQGFSPGQSAYTPSVPAGSGHNTYNPTTGSWIEWDPCQEVPPIVAVCWDLESGAGTWELESGAGCWELESGT